MKEGYPMKNGDNMDQIDEINEVIAKAKDGDHRNIRNMNKRPTRDGPHERIKNILLLSSEYDHFMLEEEGRLSVIFRNYYEKIDRGSSPNIIHVEDERASMRMLDEMDIDILLIFKRSGEEDVRSLTRRIKEYKPNLPVVCLSRSTFQTDQSSYPIGEGPMDWTFKWLGDGSIIPGIIQFIENGLNNKDNMREDISEDVLIVSNSPYFYSNLLSKVNEAIWGHMDSIMKEDLTPIQKRTRYERRPHVLIARTIEDAEAIYEQNKTTLLCMISDIGHSTEDTKGNELGISIVEKVKKGYSLFPVLTLSRNTDDRETANDLGVNFIQEGSPNYGTRVVEFIKDCMGPEILVFQDTSGKEVARAANIGTFEKAIWLIPDEVLLDFAKREKLTRWLGSRMEFELETRFNELIIDENDPEELRKKLMVTLEEHKRDVHIGSITEYSRKTYGPHVKFSRMGKGAMGGKAKGLAFMDKVLSTHLYQNGLPGLTISMPRTIVLCSDIFDAFIEENNIVDEEMYEITDERIGIKFMESDLPATLLGDLRAFIRETSVPIVVRSSSLLEDALLHPFAGVYSSLLLPNESWDTDLRFKELCNAVKYVYASVFFEKARTYLNSTKNSSEDEKMCVIVQELVGRKYGDVFYPTVSGVAKSFDFYPYGSCRSTDGVVNIALGLGKAVVEGGSSFRFCPTSPRSPQYGEIRELLDQSQKTFFAVDLTSYVSMVHSDEDSSLIELDIKTAEGHGALDQIASTYSSMNDRLSPGIGRDGPRVIDFSPILKLDTIPLARTIHMILQIGEIVLDGSVEIEFAMNIDPNPDIPAELFLLQIRRMVSGDDQENVNIGQYEEQDLFCRSDNILGNGTINEVQDIVYVKPEDFEIEKSSQIVAQIRKINKRMIEDNAPYVLIGPGRWGSSDNWMGIPVNWSDIAGARIIVETPIKERIIDPSQGSHFFHNMISAKAGYFTITDRGNCGIDWKWLRSLPAVEETEHLRYIHLDNPLDIRIDGNGGNGVMLKPDLDVSGKKNNAQNIH